MYRLYLDEVGTDGLTHLDQDKNRYLSLTGVAIEISHARDALTPTLNELKANIFDNDPDNPIVFHRKDIMGFKGPYQCLRDAPKQEAFDSGLLTLFERADYVVITALIDKEWMLKQRHWANRHPYHYLMEIMAEKYAQFLERRHSIGDIMPESRQSKDDLLQQSFDDVRNRGTDFVSSERIRHALPGKNLKFRCKKDNISGLQLCDLIAHPSHMYVRSRMNHPVNLGAFALRVSDILVRNKYDRSPWNAKILGYGIKHLPQ